MTDRIYHKIKMTIQGFATFIIYFFIFANLKSKFEQSLLLFVNLNIFKESMFL